MFDQTCLSVHRPKHRRCIPSSARDSAGSIAVAFQVYATRRKLCSRSPAKCGAGWGIQACQTFPLLPCLLESDPGRSWLAEELNLLACGDVGREEQKTQVASESQTLHTRRQSSGPTGFLYAQPKANKKKFSSSTSLALFRLQNARVCLSCLDLFNFALKIIDFF